MLNLIFVISNVFYYIIKWILTFFHLFEYCYSILDLSKSIKLIKKYSVIDRILLYKIAFDGSKKGLYVYFKLFNYLNIFNSPRSRR